MSLAYDEGSQYLPEVLFVSYTMGRNPLCSPTDTFQRCLVKSFSGTKQQPERLFSSSLPAA